MRLTAVRPMVPVALLVLGAALSGCFTTAADFQHDAENFILEDDDLQAELFEDTGVTFVSATCAEPADQEVDTTFACTAADSDGRAWEFEIVITGKSGYEVNVSRRPDGA